MGVRLGLAPLSPSRSREKKPRGLLRAGNRRVVAPPPESWPERLVRARGGIRWTRGIYLGSREAGPRRPGEGPAGRRSSQTPATARGKSRARPLTSNLEWQPATPQDANARHLLPLWDEPGSRGAHPSSSPRARLSRSASLLRSELALSENFRETTTSLLLLGLPPTDRIPGSPLPHRKHQLKSRHGSTTSCPDHKIVSFSRYLLTLTAVS